MIYFDNAATAFQKPKTVIKAVESCLSNFCANPGRSAHKPALDAARFVYETRAIIANFFGIKDPLRVIFTSGATESLNLAIKGSLLKGDHVITTSMEHNSVLRPLSRMKEDGVDFTIIECSCTGLVDTREIEKAIKPNTKMVICTHASNVTGTIMPVKEIGAICKKHGKLFLVDAAQTAGVYDIDVEDMNIDMLAVPGHKYLMGLQGIGFLYVGERADPTQLKEGGTGSQTASITQPDTIPDKYESGTLNLPGIVSIRAGIEFIEDIGPANIQSHEMTLTKTFLDGARSVKGATVYGHNSPSSATVAMNVTNVSSSELASILDKEYSICTRAGLHCAPLAHKTIGTSEKAAVRFSFGYFNTEEEVVKSIEALNEISGR